MTYSIVFTTSPNLKFANKVSEVLLKKKLVACVKLSPVKSSYWWRDKIASRTEILMTILTKTKLCEQIENEIKKLHPYDVPEIISFEVNKGNKAYLNWISSVTK